MTVASAQFLQALQNALIWINFRFYLAPLFWFVVGGPYGPVLLVGYAFLRAAELAGKTPFPLERASGIDRILHVLDWIPVRLAGVAYALLGHGERALPAWFAALSDVHRPQYQVLTSRRSSRWRAIRIWIKWKRHGLPWRWLRAFRWCWSW